ncbi:MAG: NAD(P)H-hydrate epimerase [Candidatus Nitrosocaldaceae archaeon]
MESISSREMYDIEEKAHNMGIKRILMMENAGCCIARFILQNFDINNKSIVAIAGSGNNGGDALVATRHLARYTKPIVLLLGKESIKTEEAKINLSIVEKIDKIRLIDIKWINKEVNDIIINADIIIDGIFGIGVKGKIKEPQATIIDLINSSDAYKIAVDIPSGLDPDNGQVLDKCVKANTTITFHKMKHGLVNSIYAGKVIVCDIGIPF